MLFGGIGLHVLVAIFFAIHVIRSGQQLYWLFILFSFPLLGSLVYFFAIYLPETRLPHGARKAMAAAGRALDPGRDLREARAAYDFTPTAQNQMRLAAALLAAGQAEEAARTYDACLQGPFANDLDIRLGAARAHAASGHTEAAIEHALAIRARDARFQQEAVALLLGKAYARAGRQDEARAEFLFASGLTRSFESRAELVIWAAAHGEPALARQHLPELEKEMQHWNSFTRQLQAELVKRLQTASASLKGQA
ncbi:hypothetical protein [Massilia sp. TS11]|uniref:hypothetical protein n=1 Tax=Massilia sp. TS11 TaxID=2908003 RepID=UPI001EDAA55D|nr:hypothetical protein [Massilia sp. TS11]MCG2585751.1 hypothetical protein [Massilia sp. TS11]